MGKVKSLRELQLAELEILKDFIKYCDDNKLKYSVCGGTFLGAVRHKGFIPWDDDIDVLMPREDYERFLDNYKGKYIIHTFENHEELYHYASRLINTNKTISTNNGKVKLNWSAWIDIFPLDGMPNKKIAFILHKAKLLIARAKFALSRMEQSPNTKKRPMIEKIIIGISKIINPYEGRDPQKYLKEIDSLLKRYTYKDANMVINFMGTYKFHEMFPKRLYEDLDEYPFETITVTAPRNYDYILKQMYGDYMTPPDKNNRNKHNNTLGE